MAELTLFRLHYADGFVLDIRAATPADARKQAARPGFITKIKRVKETADAH